MEVTANNLPLSSAQPAVRVKAVDRIVYVNVVRVYAMSIVVLIHVAAILAPHFNTIAHSDWWISNMFHAFSKGGPPIFTLVSGMLLLGSKDQPLLDFFRKRFMKVLIPFLGWAVVYLAWRAYNQGEVFTLQSALQQILDGPVYYHLWFIQMILGLYLATPILRVFVRHADRIYLQYFIGVWIFAVAIVPLISRFLHIEIGIQFEVMTGFVGYYVLGYYLRDVSLKPNQLLPVLLIIVGGILFTEVTTYFLMRQQDGNLDIFFLNNQGLNIIVIAVSMFIFLKSMPFGELYAQMPLFKRGVDLVASTSLGVYFVHVLIMEMLGSGMLGFKLGPLSFGGALVGIPVTWLITLSLSIGIILVIKRIPLVCILVP